MQRETVGVSEVGSVRFYFVVRFMVHPFLEEVLNYSMIFLESSIMILILPCFQQWWIEL